MSVVVSLRKNQSYPLTWVQVDDNFSNLAAAAGGDTTISGGPTSSRPLTPGLYQFYFDTTIGMPIITSQITPSVVWVNMAGVVV